MLPFISTSVTATDYITLDFETINTGLSPVSNKPYPLWSLQPSFDNNFGAGNHFEISEHAPHSGKYSLKFSYEARNNYCNTCGSKTVRHKRKLKDSDYFIADNAQDLTQEYYPAKLRNPKKPERGTFTPAGPHAAVGKIIYNKSRGYSRWQITGVENHHSKNDRLSLKLLQPGVGEYKNIKPVFNGGDKVAITRHCGIDGIIGKVRGKYDITRRSDCNNIITWFGKIPANVQPSGTSIFRRVYLKTDIKDPPSGHKLNYARMLRGGNRDQFREIDTVASLRGKDIELHLAGFKKMGGLGRYKPGTNKPGNMPEELKFEPDTWYYLEQEYKAETFKIKTHTTAKGKVIIDSYSGKGDGEYRLWIAKSGEETMTPVLIIKNLRLPPLLGGSGTHMSLWGNIGHHEDSYGSWYMDDIKISTEKIGPLKNTEKAHSANGEIR